jgi:ABC-2 type transport system ATP-binding protein
VAVLFFSDDNASRVGRQGISMLVEVENLSKTFDEFRAVDNVSFGLERGEIVGMLGPNGAGKTTTIHMILGLITPTSGRISIFGESMDTNRERILERMNFTSPYTQFPIRLTVMENLIVFARIYNLKRPRERIEQLLEQFGIAKLRDKAVSRLSSGENTRVGLCKAFMNDPELILLDEPTAYLDPEIAWQVKNALLDAQREKGTTILYTSHNMDEVERMCKRIIFLHHGKVIAEGSPIEITQAILEEEREEPALEEVFMRVVKGKAA